MLGAPQISLNKCVARWLVVAACVLGTACTEQEPVAIARARPVAGAAFGVASPSGYVAHDLLPPGFYGFANDVNASSVVVGDAGNRAVKWIHAQQQLLAPYPGQLDSRASAINDSGAIVGNVRVAAAPQYRALLWTGNAVSALPSPNDAHAADINNAGVIVGYESTSEGARAVKWVDQTRVDIHPPGAVSSYAFAVSEYGDIVGMAKFGPQDPYLAYLWPATGIPFSLPMLPNATECVARDAGIKGVVVGYCSGAGAFRWTAGSGTIPLGWGPPDGRAEGVSSLLRFVGAADYPTQSKVAITLRQGVVDTLPNPLQNWINSLAVAVNKCGTIVGGYEEPPSLAWRPVMWTKPACDT